jgi:hypothetical protein
MYDVDKCTLVTKSINCERFEVLSQMNMNIYCLLEYDALWQIGTDVLEKATVSIFWVKIGIYLVN